MRREGGPVEDISELSGLAHNNLPMAFILAMLLFSLAGVPPLAGFFAKFYVFAAAVKAELYGLAIIGVMASVVGAFYYLRIIKVMFFDEASPQFTPTAPYVRLVMIAAGAFVVLYAVYPAPLIDAAAAAARSLQL
jgi:NADH-quinone oxidoreductase subunit N